MLADRLVCPLCGESLVLRNAFFACAACSTWYPIVRTVPVLLDFSTPLHEEFARAHLSELGDLHPPNGAPRPGEEWVQSIFTEEWGTSVESELSFIYSAEDLVRLNRDVWLRWLDDEGTRSILDVGCGAGAEAVALRSVAPHAEVVGVDLNFALLSSPIAADPPEGVRFVVASLFALPFRERSFDLVYSQGVLHHTYSTPDAFRAIAPLAGKHLFVWLYALEDRLAARGKRGLAIRGAIAIERVLRPLVSRAPEPARNAFFAAATRAAHPLLKPRMRHAERWEPQNTETFLRDLLSPPYAHRHGWNEVIEWFEEEGFEIVDVQSPTAYRTLFGAPLWGVGLTGRLAD